MRPVFLGAGWQGQDLSPYAHFPVAGRPPVVATPVTLFPGCVPPCASVGPAYPHSLSIMRIASPVRPLLLAPPFLLTLPPLPFL
jgi:hypothetical protein